MSETISIEYLLAGRQMAFDAGDLAVVREYTLELQRLGYVESAVPTSTEAAVPPRPRGRPRKNPAPDVV